MGDVLIKARTRNSGKVVYEYRFEVASIDGKRQWKSKSGFATKRRRSGGVDMGLMKPRVSSYVDRGNELIAKGKTKQAMNLVSHGLQYYSERVIDSISPYAKNDAGLIVLVLRHLADEVEKNNPGAKELAAGMEKCVGKPSLQEIERIKKPNRK